MGALNIQFWLAISLYNSIKKYRYHCQYRDHGMVCKLPHCCVHVLKGNRFPFKPLRVCISIAHIYFAEKYLFSWKAVFNDRQYNLTNLLFY